MVADWAGGTDKRARVRGQRRSARANWRGPGQHKITPMSPPARGDAISAGLTSSRVVASQGAVTGARAKAEAMAAYARQAKDKGLIQWATEINLRAQRRCGEMLKSTPKAKGAQTVGGDKRSGGTILVPPEDAQTLADLGLTKKESALAQKLASLPEKSFEQVRDGAITVAKAVAAVEAAKLPAALGLSKPIQRWWAPVLGHPVQGDLGPLKVLVDREFRPRQDLIGQIRG